jgi:hypothetical protein
MIYKTLTRNVELDLNMDSIMSNMDSNINSSARFLVQFHPENRPYREHVACAEHHGNVADLDIETANPYFVEMHTSWALSDLIGEKKVPTMKKGSSKPAPVPAQGLYLVGKHWDCRDLRVLWAVQTRA